MFFRVNRSFPRSALQRLAPAATYRTISLGLPAPLQSALAQNGASNVAKAAR